MYANSIFYFVPITSPHIHVLEPSLMLENLNTVMESVSEGGLEGVGEWLHVPRSKQRELEQQYPLVAQRKRAYSAYYLSHHPAPCWWIIAIALYIRKELEALKVVQKLYLRGEPYANRCKIERRIDTCAIVVCVSSACSVLSTEHCLLFV